jgi:iron donor protein CyaY
MESSDFYKTSAKALAHIDTALGEIDADGLDVQLAGDVLTVGFADGARFVINAHSAARQIWMAAGTTAWHFDTRGRSLGRAADRRRADADRGEGGRRQAGDAGGGVRCTHASRSWLRRSRAAGCATISTTASVRTLPGGRDPRGPARVVDRQLEARWVQRGDSLAVELVEHRRCQSGRASGGRPRGDRCAAGRRGDLLEYGLAAVLLGLSAFSFARPELFAVQQRSDEGRLYREAKTGYTLGGVFLGLGAAALGRGSTTACGRATGCTATRRWRCCRGRRPTARRRRCRRVSDSSSCSSGSIAGAGSRTSRGGCTSRCRGRRCGRRPRSRRTARRRSARAWQGTLRAGLARELAIEVVLPYDATLVTPRAGVTRSAAL